MDKHISHLHTHSEELDKKFQELQNNMGDHVEHLHEHSEELDDKVEYLKKYLEK